MSTPRGFSKSPSQAGNLTGFFKANAAKLNIFIPLDLLMDEINYSLSVDKVNAFAARHNFSIDWQKLNPQIILLANMFNIGKVTETDFRVAIRELLNISDLLSDEDFDDIWGAMLGKLKHLRIELEELTTLRNNHNIFIFSMTNSLHIQRIISFLNKDLHSSSRSRSLHAVNDASIESKDETPTISSLKIHGMPLYVSYHQSNPIEAQRHSPTNILDEIVAAKGIATDKILLITAMRSLSADPRVKKLNEGFSHKLCEWAKNLKISIINHDRIENESVADNLEKYIRIKNASDITIAKPLSGIKRKM